MTQYLKRKQKQSGFTLVELLVVIAIIGILTAIGVPMYNGYQTSAKVSATKQNFDSMKTFIAGEVTKCSAGLVKTLSDPKITQTVDCTTTLSPGSMATYFYNYALATMKNPYTPSDSTPVVAAIPPGKVGQMGIANTSGGGACDTGIGIQVLIVDPNDSTKTVGYPSAAECIVVQ